MKTQTKTINMEMSINENKNISQQINKLFANENYDKAIELLTDNLKTYPYDHWLLAQLSICYYELKNYDKALEISNEAIKLSPNCPLTLDYRATILFANKNIDEAKNIWLNLLNINTNKLANDACGEGVQFALSLQNDIRFMLGDLYLELNDKTNALYYYKLHLEYRKRGLFSNYSKKEVLNEIKKLEK